MSPTTDTTTLICLFHHDDQAKAALDDLYKAGIPQAAITTLHGSASEANGNSSELSALGIPARDLDHLQDGLNHGGTLISVSALAAHVDDVERIFGDHRATKIDEIDNEQEYAGGVLPLAAAASVVEGQTVIPIVEEELQVGKRTVDQGGVRVYRRVVEIPVEKTVSLREEHVVLERNFVDRPATEADLAQGSRSIELIETAEEAVIGKNARVVEEVLIGKQTGERTETIHDTVRRTEVEMEELPSSRTSDTTRNL